MTNSSQPSGGVVAAFRCRPAVAIVLFLAGGIALRDVLLCRPWLWVICIFVLLVLAGFLNRRSRWADLSLALAVALVGLLAAQIDFYRYPLDHIWTYTAESERFSELELRIDESPRLTLPAPDDPRMLEPKQTVRAVVTAIHTRSGWQPAGGSVILNLEQLNPRLAAGQTVRATGLLERPGGPMNPGEFDYYGWERSQRMLATMRVSHPDGVQILSESGPGLVEWLREKTRHLLAEGFTLDHSYDHALLRAFVLGDSDPQLNDLEERLVNTGTVHCMSVSGLHIAIAGGFVLFVGRLLRASPRSSLIAALLAVTLYGLVATPTWPGWRSILMFAAFSIGLLFHRWPDSIQLFCAAIAAILLIHPADLANGGFQISFAAVLGMILFAPRLLGWFWRTWRGPDAVALRPALRGAAVNAGLWLVRFFVSAIVATVIAWLMVLPLIAYHYGQLNTYSAPAGVILLPVTVVALLFGLAKIGLTFCWPSAAHAWAVVCSIPVAALRHIVELISKIPGSTIPLPTPSVGVVVIYYALFAVALFHWRTPWLHRLGRLAPVLAVAVMFLSPLISASQGSSMPRIRITLLSLGSGQCAVVRTSDNHAILIDAGSETVSDLRRRLLTPYLRAIRCSNIDQMILSSSDYDDISAAEEVFHAYHPPAILFSPLFAPHAMGNVPAEQLLETLLDAQCWPRFIKKGDHLQLPGGATIEVLWPPPDRDMTSNNSGLVLKLAYAGRTMIFPADIRMDAERELLRNRGDLKCDILVAPHGGSDETTTAAFLRAANPRIILASNAYKLTRKQRIFDILARGRELYRTSKCGAITITIDAAGNISTETFLPNFP